jgi:hypothetical protein
MAVQDYFTDEERERQVALDRSWQAGQRHVGDMFLRDALQQRIAELPPPPQRADLSPAQQQIYDARERSYRAAQATSQDPARLAQLAAVIAELDAGPPVHTDPEELLRRARA